ncbi:hypothetical protein A2625_01510 [candidate division WOR-1 bacterium RIFCSPHIGHO2_01_FULL_53_15]|uniref:DUF6036 domain-containing protein n=1 Tax=candidate division WOR-1 bacterium RIFCSPHIGHO2_01_FULL_53_15 TaxID=1802564 RepID=A0A1F4Q259_UNCSA|nr:MAG: hypothetical protein A2625_01510 [candidate division WOR-1 bacterium RIFCSPHIGHO2_01_FULL_53_15]OGC13665.1 MAG: hypothetical protein A3D23_06495 [candidate division WOR-1 bacterium RIFCSPHIGHO2_02_FULL_53_26]
MPSIVDALFKLLALLNRLKLPHMLVGGFAVNYYGAPRATGDIDISILADSDNIEEFLSALKKNRFTFHKKDVLTLVKISNRFLIFDPSNIYRIDCWLPKTDFELKALDRRVKVKILGKTVFLPSVEDLILFKLLAGRAKDYEDLKWIIKRQINELDNKYLKFWSIALNVHHDLQKFLKA